MPWLLASNDVMFDKIISISADIVSTEPLNWDAPLHKMLSPLFDFAHSSREVQEEADISWRTLLKEQEGWDGDRLRPENIQYYKQVFWSWIWKPRLGRNPDTGAIIKRNGVFMVPRQTLPWEKMKLMKQIPWKPKHRGFAARCRTK